MNNLDNLYRELVEPSPNPPAPPGRRNITLRLPLETHDQLDHIRTLAVQSKTVAAEEILISAIADLHQRMVKDERLEDFWAARAEEEQDRLDSLQHQAEQYLEDEEHENYNLQLLAEKARA